MSITYIPANVRRFVARRAGRICEYCLIHEDDTYFGCHIDHIISEKHGGLLHADNLAFTCAFCNRNKGSDIGSILDDVDRLIRFYNPRSDDWSDHFAIDSDGYTINPLTPIGIVTARILGFNDADRLIERQELWLVGRYPPLAAKR